MEEEPNTHSNRNQENNDISNHVISFSEQDQEWLSSVEDKFKVLPKLLNISAGKEACCIFRVPQSLVEINEKTYQPHIVSIGPYHHGQPHLKMIQEQKYRFLRALLARTQSHGIDLKEFYRTIASMENNIRECYSETIEYSSHELIEMMILDGCFIIEIFYIVGGFVKPGPDDPIFVMEWIIFSLMRDLLRLENQIPFFVLQYLFAKSVQSSVREKVPTLTELALGFFDHAAQRPRKHLDKYKHHEGKHLLDLFRLTLIPESQDDKRCLVKKEDKRRQNPPLQLIQSALKLHVAGIRFAPSQAESRDIKFKNGALKIPPFTIDDFSSSVLLNCVAFEQCYHHCIKHITSYTIFMGCLINTPADAGFLGDRGIIENCLGTDEEVVKFFSEAQKDITFDIQVSYLSKVYEDVHGHYKNKWLVRWAEFKHTYFGTPWSIMSAVAALLLLLLTMIQSFFAVYQYVRPLK